MDMIANIEVGQRDLNGCASFNSMEEAQETCENFDSLLHSYHQTCLPDECVSANLEDLRYTTPRELSDRILVPDKEEQDCQSLVKVCVFPSIGNYHPAEKSLEPRLRDGNSSLLLSANGLNLREERLAGSTDIVGATLGAAVESTFGASLEGDITSIPKIAPAKPEIDSAWIAALKQQIHYHQQAGVQHAEIYLPHSRAGAMQLQVSIEAQQLTLNLRVENSLIRDALEGTITQLRQSLSSSGLQLAQSSIDLCHSDGAYSSHKKIFKKGYLSESDSSTEKESNTIFQSNQAMSGRFSAII